ncbi:MAG TPA: thiamine diphosphokinase [Candidatus Diapherotrites archaeon]|uniref:Thiamine diphosphokinase n=1 Tax=Candidatus Iainarchaeum sp. TaxID=3101447 RepID=A0A7J4IXH7_9ARCH|nr:thiamine diphosphokinase [Candidatus Diapherotrites archaeon]
MRRAVLVCNGSIDTKHLYVHIGNGDFLIAVDGGANKLIKTNFVPSLLIGDMDSISSAAQKKYRKVKQLKFSPDGNLVDLELALNYCIEKNLRDILVLGAVGSRVDMTLANILCLAKLPGNTNCRIMHENQEIFLLPKKFIFVSVPGEKVSFIPLGGDVKGLTLRGFKFELKDYTLPFGTGIGISNELRSKRAGVSFTHGKLLCVHMHKWF